MGRANLEYIVESIVCVRSLQGTWGVFMKKMTRLVGSPHTTCVRYRQVMEQVMVEIVGVKEGSGGHSRGEEKGRK